MAADEFFIYKFSREQAGLSGLAFDEGQFGVFGYVTAVRALAQACAMRLKVHSLKQSVFENVMPIAYLVTSQCCGSLGGIAHSSACSDHEV
jgi:hypothetical protein